MRLATRSSSCCCCGDQPLVLRGGGVGVPSRAPRPPGRAPARSFSSRSTAACRSASACPRGGERLLERLRLLALLARLALGLGQELVRLFLGLEQGFLLAGLGVALGVAEDAGGLLFGAADGLGGDALAVGDPDGEHGGRRDERDDADQVPTIGITRDVLSVTHVGLTGSAPRAGLPASRVGGETNERPRFAVWGGR